MRKLIDCPRHEGAYDCGSFCDVCEGEQRYEWTATRGCRDCGTAVDHDTWMEELGFCLDCSNQYFGHYGNYDPKWGPMGRLFWEGSKNV